ncbi:MAG: hypothetical protein IPM68_05710 [Flavobacteriales bacterium]|nr:hypothetical protein [Flavobacteriales bacterium]
MRWDALRTVVALLAITAWVSVDEFVRNGVVLPRPWAEHYAGLGLEVPRGTGERRDHGACGPCSSPSPWCGWQRRHPLWSTGLTAWWVGFARSCGW